MRGAWVFPVIVGACGFSPGGAAGGGGFHDAPGVGDANVFDDGRPDAPSDSNCFGRFTYDTVCYNKAGPQPTGTLNVNGDLTIDSQGTMCDASAIGVPGTCVVAANAMTLTSSARITITGSRPVIFLATGAAGIDLNGGSAIDVGSAGTMATCAGSQAPTEHGGGFGGSFVVVGGKGGKDVAGNGAGVPATALGANPVTLRGGCPGGAGAADVGGTATVPGKPGGAIVMIGSVVTVNGMIAAYGRGGGATQDNFIGGAGGGAGGMVVLDGDVIRGNGEIDVKGGGGGAGAGGNGGTFGYDGWVPALRSVEGNGGVHVPSGAGGGHGGPYSENATPSGENGSDGIGAGGSTGSTGGGGGGGAIGVIILGVPQMNHITGTS